jgi:hypothetical protein
VITAAFDPRTHGFAFGNTFVNVIGTLPGFGEITTRGRCGGMAYASLDYYHAGLAVPESAELPPDGTALADLVYRRLLDSYLVPSATKFVSWTLYSDDETWFYKGVTRWTKEDEFPRLTRAIRGGVPQVLGLVTATDVRRIGDDHQVVAYGCEDDGRGGLTVLLYDNRYPGQEVRLSTTAATPRWNLEHAGGREEWRGFFVQGYSSKVPEFLREGTVVRERSPARRYVVYGGAKFAVADDAQLAAIGASTEFRTLGDGSASWIADVPADRTLLREVGDTEVYVMEDRHRRRVADVSAFRARGLSFDDVRVVPDGALAAIPRGADL